MFFFSLYTYTHIFLFLSLSPHTGFRTITMSLPLPPSKRQRTEALADPRPTLISSSGLQLSRKIPFDSAYIVSEYLGHLPGSAYRPPCSLNKCRYCLVCDQDLRIVNATVNPGEEADTRKRYRRFVVSQSGGSDEYPIGPLCNSLKGCADWYLQKNQKIQKNGIFSSTNIAIRRSLRTCSRPLQPSFDTVGHVHTDGVWRKAPGRPPVLCIGDEGAVSTPDDMLIYWNDTVAGIARCRVAVVWPGIPFSYLMEEDCDGEEERPSASQPRFTYAEENTLLHSLCRQLFEHYQYVIPASMERACHRMQVYNQEARAEFKELSSGLTPATTTPSERKEIFRQLSKIVHDNVTHMKEHIRQEVQETRSWIETTVWDLWMEEMTWNHLLEPGDAESDRILRRFQNNSRYVYQYHYRDDKASPDLEREMNKQNEQMEWDSVRLTGTWVGDDGGYGETGIHTHAHMHVCICYYTNRNNDNNNKIIVLHT